MRLQEIETPVKVVVVTWGGAVKVPPPFNNRHNLSSLPTDLPTSAFYKDYFSSFAPPSFYPILSLCFQPGFASTINSTRLEINTQACILPSKSPDTYQYLLYRLRLQLNKPPVYTAAAAAITTALCYTALSSPTTTQQRSG